MAELPGRKGKVDNAGKMGGLIAAPAARDHGVSRTARTPTIH